MNPALRSILLAIFAAWHVALARGVDPLPAAGSVPSEFGNATHGWVVMQSRSAAPWMLCHVTPRRSRVESEGTSAGSEPGSARFAMNLESIPLGLAAMGPDLVLAFDFDTPGSAGERRMFRLRAERDPGSGLWRTMPLGRLEMLGVLPPGELLDFFGTARGPAAVLREPGGEVKLAVHVDSWREISLPEELARGLKDGKLRCSTGGSGALTLLLEAGEHLELWSAPFQARMAAAGWTPPGPYAVSTFEDGPEAKLTVNWSVRMYETLPEGLGAGVRLERFGDSVYAAKPEGGGLSIWVAGPESRLVRLKDVRGVPDRCGVIGLSDSRRMLIAWVEGVDPESMVRRGIEVELGGGTILHDGSLKMSGPVSGTDYRMVVALLVMVTASTLAFILNPDDGRPFSLPDGYSLATGGVRLVAASLDVAISFAICRVALRFGSWDASEGFSIELAAGTLLAVFLLGVCCEAASGKTPGKMLVGLELIRVVKRAGGDLEAARPSLGGVLLRNVVKWIALPVSAIGMFSAGGRGRPDQLAGTVVVCRVESERIDEEDLD